MTPHMQAAPAHRNRPLAIAAGLLIILALASALAAGCGGSKAESPPAAEQSQAQSAAPATPPEGGATAISAEAGEAMFKQRCVLCHGPEGHGDGPGSAGLNPKPRNLTDKTYMSTRTDEQLAEVIKNGKGAMPAWGKAGVTDDQIKALVLYVRTLAK